MEKGKRLHKGWGMQFIIISLSEISVDVCPAPTIFPFAALLNFTLHLSETRLVAKLIFPLGSKAAAARLAFQPSQCAEGVRSPNSTHTFGYFKNSSD